MKANLTVQDTPQTPPAIVSQAPVIPMGPLSYTLRRIDEECENTLDSHPTTTTRQSVTLEPIVAAGHTFLVRCTRSKHATTITVRVK